MDIWTDFTDILSSAGDNILKNANLAKVFSGFFNWVRHTIFKGKDESIRKIDMIEKNEASKEDIASLIANMKFAVEDDSMLKMELLNKIEDIQRTLEANRLNTNITLSGSGESSVTSNVIYQSHSGSGDNIGKNKINS